MRWKQLGGTVPCPASIIAYNKFMGGVDCGDQLRGYYRCRSKSGKFYKCIFFFLFDVTITNTCIWLTSLGSYPFKDFKSLRLQAGCDGPNWGILQSSTLRSWWDCRERNNSRPSAIFRAFQSDGRSSYFLVGHSVQAKVSKAIQLPVWFG